MKLIKRIAAGCAALMLLSSCSILSGLGANNTAASTGSDTGSAIAAIYNILKATGGIDLSNLTNIINIGKILTGANSLASANQDYTNAFATALINGSSNLVNSSNVNSVLNGLKALSSMDTSAFQQASTAKGFAGSAPAISTSDENVAATMSVLNGILGSL